MSDLPIWTTTAGWGCDEYDASYLNNMIVHLVWYHAMQFDRFSEW